MRTLLGVAPLPGPYADTPARGAPRAPARRRLLATGGLGLALGVTNLLAAPRLGRVASTAWNLGTTAVVLGLGRWSGVDRAAIGLDRQHLRRGLATGAAGSAVIALLLGAASATAAGQDLLDDDRVVDATWVQTGLHVGIFIPWGTVVLEEVAFRGVLPALLDPELRTVPATIVIPALAFGAWHIVSGRDFTAAHDDARADGRATGSVPGIVAATTLAGLVLGQARHRSGHLVAPALMHVTGNALATVLGRLVGRRRVTRVGRLEVPASAARGQ